MTILEFRNLQKSFGPVVALDQFQLELREGELISLLGPSGCGKTTALRIAAGFVHPDDGQVFVDNVDTTNVPTHKRNMGMVFQNYSLFPNLTVEENIEFGLRTRKVAKSERQSIVKQMLEVIQMPEMVGRYPHQLSGGQQQRVALARALAIRPDILLLDEPLSALDAQVRLDLRQQIRKVQQEFGITTIFVTHDQEEALAISDRVAVMSSGRLEQLGTPFDVYNKPKTDFVARFIGLIVELPVVVSAPNEVKFNNCTLSTGVLGVPVGHKTTLMVRPEEFVLAPLDDAHDGLIGFVKEIEFRGSQSLLKVEIQGISTTITALAPAHLEMLTQGAQVSVRLVDNFNRRSQD